MQRHAGVLRGLYIQCAEVENAIAVDMRFNIQVHNYNLITQLVENALCDLFLDTTMYSFSTRLHEDTDIDDSAIIFGIVNINIGNGYDEFTGLK